MSHHNLASVLLSILSDEEKENLQINASEEAPIDSISDDEWSAYDDE